MAISDELRKLVDPNNECCCEHCLGNRCKEWALKKDKYKWLFSYKAFIDCWCDIVDNHNRKNIIMSFRADTEPEAIFKACEWILKDKR